ncbi:hypothetical protein J2S21_004250 [Peribacillus cavernae]|nr:hypothetical protein [Peribacillus cavernae]
MSKAKGKGGTGRGTDKKGWNRWKASENKAKSAKPYTSKGVKKTDAVKPAIILFTFASSTSDFEQVLYSFRYFLQGTMLHQHV